MQPRKLRSERTDSIDVDVVEPLKNTRDSRLGTCVVSCENKLSREADGILVAHYVVTGLVLPRSDWQIPELRPVVLGQHAIDRLDWNRSSAGVEQELLHRGWPEFLRQVEPLALSSRASGGLSQITYPINESVRATLSNNGDVLPQRERVQLGRFLMAHSHLTLHIETDPEVWQLRAANGERLGFKETELYIGELYSLARSFGVKEILPKILRYMGDEVRDITQSTEEKDSLTKLASLIVKLKRKGMLSK